MASIKDLQDQMNKNSAAWHGASQAEKDRLHQENQKLQQQIDSMNGSTSSFNHSTGKWTTTSGSSSGSSKGSSTSGVNTWTDDQQAMKDKMDANSQAWHNATSQAEKDRLHAENQQLAGQLGGNVSFNPSTGKWTTTSGSSSGSSKGSSTSGVNTWTDDQQAMKDKMDANSQAWHNATSQAEKDRLHAENQQLAGQLGGNVSFNPGSGTWSGSANPGSGTWSGSASNEQQEQSSLVNDYSNYLEEMYAANRKAALAAINNAYQQNVNAIERAGEGVDTRYQNARNQAAGSAELAARNFAEYAAAYGLGSGTSGQAELARNITLQNNLNDLTAEEAGIYADLELQKSNAEVEYNNAIAEAEANNDSQLAAALYQEKIRVQNALIEEQARLFEQNLAERQFQFQQQQADVSNNRWQQQFDYQKQQDQLAAEQQNKQYLAAWGEAMLENGFMPTEEMLAAMGLSSYQAQPYMYAYKKKAAKSSSSGSYSGTYSGNQTAKDNSGNQSYTIDMNSVLQLGYGPIDSDSLANLEAQGKIESYTDGNLIKFRKVSAPSKTTTSNNNIFSMPSLGLLGR